MEHEQRIAIRQALDERKRERLQTARGTNRWWSKDEPSSTPKLPSIPYREAWRLFMADKEVDQLIKKIRARGFRVVASGKGHKKILDQSGKPVVDENGPVIISSTPSDANWYDMSMHRLIKAGVFDSDPRKGHFKGGNGASVGEQRPSERDEQAEKQREAILLEAKRRTTRTKRIRERIEPMVAKLGGWESYRFGANLGTVAYYLNKDQIGRWPTLDAAIESAHNLRTGNTQSDPSAECWERVCAELESHRENPRDHFFYLLRKAKGIETPEPQEREDPESILEEVTIDQNNGSLKAGTLALRAVALMGAGVTDEDLLDKAVELGQEIMKLELIRGG